MVALAAVRGDFHFAQQRIHFGDRQHATGTDAAVARHRADDRVEALGQAVRGVERRQIIGKVADQRHGIGRAEQRRRALSQAKVQLGNSMRQVGQQCTQIHGGIGVTDEYISSHYFKRLTMLEMAYGDTLHHLGEVSCRMTETAGVFA